MTDQIKKYANYFDEEEEEENVEPHSLNTQTTKNNLVKDNKIVNQPKKQLKLKDTDVFSQKNTNTEEKNFPNQKQSNSESSPKSGSDNSSKNSEYKMPFPKNKTKKENGNNNNINNNSKAAMDNKKNNPIDSNPEKDPGEQVEYYENLDDLMKANSDENMEYDLVGMDELQEYLAGGLEGLDFDLKDMETEEPEKEIEKLEKSFNEDPLNYETLYKLIYLYRETKNAEKLKYFRNYTQMYFPISDDMWKEWIKDELIEINKNNPDNFDLKVQLIDLYERALRDFYYIKICKRFLKYVIFLKKERESKHPDIVVDEKYSDYFTLEGIRKKFENILDLWGLDFNLSQKVWDIYLDFEKENYNNFRSSGNEDEACKTENIIRSIFRRRLSFPHIDLDIVWKDYKNWEKSEDNLEKVEHKYKESSQKCEEFINLEENFYELIEVAAKESYAGKLVLFLKVEIPKISKKYYNYAKLYFEKALEYNCDNFDIWKMYIEHTKNNSKDKAWLVSIMLRSCKCCFFCVDLWKMLILEMEKNFYAKEDIQKKLQEAYQSVEERSEKLEIFVFSVLFNFRNYVPKPNLISVNAKKEINFEDVAEEETNLNAKTVDPELESIRFEIKNLVEDLKTNKDIEILMQIYKFWAEFETYKTQDKKQMEEIMNELVRIDSSPDMWLNYISYEKYFGDPTSIRKVFKRSIEYCKTDKKMLSVKWIEWESILGTISDLENAERYLKTKKLGGEKPSDSKFPNKKAERKPIRENQTAAVKGKKINKRSNKNQQNYFEKEEDLDMDELGNLEYEPGNIEDFEVNDEKELLEIEDTMKPKKTKKKGKKEDKLSKGKKKSNQKEAETEELNYDFYKKEDVNLSLEEEHDEQKSENNNKSFSQDMDWELTKHDRTIIIKNLARTVDEQELQEFLEENSPDVKTEDIRIVRDKKGFSKGFAFVDFFNKYDAEVCLGNINGKEIEGESISCAISKPPSSGENDQRTIYVNNLPFNITKEKIQEVFDKYGQILDIRIILDPETNQPKGYCYIEYLKEESVTSVLEDKKNISIEDRKIFIKKSQSVTKIRENLKNVLFVSNLPFGTDEDKLRAFLEKEDISNIIDVLIVRDDSGKSKGFGFVELGDEENMEKALNLKGAMIKGRPIVIKKSNRNITKSNPNKKRKREQEEDFEHESYEEKQQDVRKTKKTKKEGTEFDKQYKEEEADNFHNVPVKREAMILNKNDSYVPKKENEDKKAKMKNTDFKKFLNK